MRFLLIHDGFSEESIKNFFYDVYEYYVKVIYIFDFITIGPAEPLC